MKTLALLLPSIILAGLLVWKWGESLRLRDQVTRLQLEVDAMRDRAPKAAPQSVQEKHLAKPRPDGDAKGAQLATGTKGRETGKQAKNPFEEFGSALTEMMKNEDTKQALKDLSAGSLEQANSELLELLNLSPEAQKVFLDALADAKQRDDAMGLRFLTVAAMSPEEKQAFIKEFEAMKRENREKIEAALGDPEKVAQYQRYRDSQPERDLLNGLRKPLESKGMAMDETQEQKLMDLIYKERKAYPWEHDYGDDTDLNPAKFTDAAVNRLWQQVDEFDQQTDPKIAQILSPEQMRIYQSQRTQTRAMHKIFLNLVKGLFNE